MSGKPAGARAPGKRKRAQGRLGAGAPDPVAIVVTCEHGGHQVPPPYEGLFRSKRRLLESHRGWDAGALVLARRLAHSAGATLFASRTTRLLCDLNRSLGNPRLFSEATRGLDAEERERILLEHWRPYRTRVEAYEAGLLAAGRTVLHIGVHSFTPSFDGVVRTADIGLLYDPRRTIEKTFCARWRAALMAHGAFRVRLNYPYRGVSDGLTTHLRRRFPPERYLGLELEVNQALLEHGRASWRRAQGAVVDALLEVVGVAPGSPR